MCVCVCVCVCVGETEKEHIPLNVKIRNNYPLNLHSVTINFQITEERKTDNQLKILRSNIHYY